VRSKDAQKQLARTSLIKQDSVGYHAREYDVYEAMLTTLGQKNHKKIIFQEGKPWTWRSKMKHDRKI